MSISFDGVNKIATLSTGTTTLSVIDLYSRWVDWLLSSDNSKYPFMFSTVGGDTIDATSGTSIPTYAFLQNGWRVKPQEASHTLNVTNGILLVSGGGDPFVSTVGSFVVRINYSQPVQAITVSTGGGSGATLAQIEGSTILAKEVTSAAIRSDLATLQGSVNGLVPGLSTNQATMLLEMYVLLGLDPTKPLIVNGGSRSAGGISQVIDTNSSRTIVTRS